MMMLYTPPITLVQLCPFKQIPIVKVFYFGQDISLYPATINIEDFEIVVDLPVTNLEECSVNGF
jgi:hypothetical protein